MVGQARFSMKPITKMEINMQEVISVARVPWETRRQQGQAAEELCWVISTEAKAKSAGKELKFGRRKRPPPPECRDMALYPHCPSIYQMRTDGERSRTFLLMSLSREG